ncbi:MAG: biotin/lipoyl-binding protein [Tannerella sp.]|jgi:biotin carboxyl carrier protein|nr:biotin/lipoyl-binding protein [Tannerella sp.]
MEENIRSKAPATYYASVDGLPDEEYKVEILEDGPVRRIAVNGTVYEVDYNVGGDSIHSILLNNRSHGVQISAMGDSGYEVKNRGDLFRVRVIGELEKMRRSRTRQVAAGRQVIAAQMPGVILKVYVKPGQEVQAGDPLCVLVAMKMENEIRSPINGEVKEVFIKEGDKMTVNDKMLVVE